MQTLKITITEFDDDGKVVGTEQTEAVVIESAEQLEKLFAAVEQRQAVSL